MPVLGMILLALVATAGLALVKAGRDIDTADGRGHSDLGVISAFVDENLRRTRTAVDTLIQPDVTVADVRPSHHALRERGATYAVFGLGMVGIAAFIAVGMLLI